MNERTGVFVADQIEITPVADKRDLKAFIDVAYRINADTPHWVPPLRNEVEELLTPGRNPFHDHAKVQYFLAKRGGKVVGRISAHFDELALAQPPEQGMGPGTGNWGLFEAEDEDVAKALIARAEQWLRDEGMTRVLAPISMSIWEEPGLLVKGFDHSPMIMMGHNKPEYEGWIEGAGYVKEKSLFTYDLDVRGGFGKLIDRIISSGEKNDRITVRPIVKARFIEEAETCIEILNDAWSSNWGFVPFTEKEIKYGAKKLRPLALENANMIAEYDGRPVAFMLGMPDVNGVLKTMNGRLFPFNWIRLLSFIRKPRTADFRVPLMGVRKEFQNTRLASQIAFRMIEYIRRYAVAHHNAKRAEIGWILEDNKGMVSIADAIGSNCNREYRLYTRPL